jgi:hypothetical protein
MPSPLSGFEGQNEQNLLGSGPSDGETGEWGRRYLSCHGDCSLTTDHSELCMGQHQRKICKDLSNSKNMVFNVQ